MEQLTSSQFAQWMAYADLEPFGPHLDDLRHGQNMALTCNINRNSKTRAVPFTSSEFMICPPGKIAGAEATETPQQIAQRIKTEIFGM